MGRPSLVLVCSLAVITLAPFAEALFFETGAAAGTAIVGNTGATAATGGLVFAAGGLQAATVLTGGVAILGTVALLAALSAGRGGRAGRHRGKRSIEEQHVLDLELAVLSQIEPEQCFRRLVCDLATGQMPPSQNDLIVSLFEDAEDIDVTSALFEYTIASKLGKVTGDITSCELRYRCSFTGAQILETAARR